MLTLFGNEHINKIRGFMLCVFDLSWETNLPPWLEQTDEKYAIGKPTEHTGKQELDCCWSGTGFESPFSDSALPCQLQLDRDRDRDRKRDLMQNVQRQSNK